MKFFKRLFTAVLILAVTAIIVNYKTRFFKDIDEYIPYIGQNYPQLAEFFSDASDSVNEAISHLPAPKEIIARIRGIELPIDPDDIASNIYYSSDTMLTFYNKNNISVASDGTEIDVYGITDNENSKHLVFRFLDKNGEMLSQHTTSCDSDGKFRKIMEIPDNSYQFVMFSGPEMFGEFSSTFFDYIYLKQNTDGSWLIPDSPVLAENIANYEKNKSVSSALKSTYAICSSDPEIASLAQSITNNLSGDYEKALAIHDWVCKNIYYDSDSINGSYNTAPYVASDVLEEKRAVCLGYANLYAALCRSISIPCNVVTGYALGVNENDSKNWNDINLSETESNHAWNEVYTDNRWVIVDTTWDSHNKIVNFRKESSDDISHLYFDANIRFFSVNHKIIEYVKR